MNRFQRKRLQREAAAWIMRLPNATAVEKANFFSWLKTSKHHVRELILADWADCELARLWNVAPNNEGPPIEERRATVRMLLVHHFAKSNGLASR